MEARELRIGNIISQYYNSFGLGVAAPYWRDWRMDLGADIDQVLFNPNMYKPIPLTEEWLVRLGFNNTRIGLFEKEVLQYGKINIHITKSRILVELGTKSCYLFGNTKIKHVHSLQNLYFALTGEELELKS